MTDREARRRLTRHYRSILQAINECLYTEDPNQIGSTIDGPKDEYVFEAEAMLPALDPCREPVSFRAKVIEFWPDASNRLVDRLWTLMTEYWRTADFD
jgi:hypothetical protein